MGNGQFVRIRADQLDTIKSAAALLSSGDVIDKREAEALRAIVTTATQPPAVGGDVSEEMVERAAEAIWNVPPGRLCWPPRREGMADEWRAFARAALTAALRTGGGE